MTPQQGVSAIGCAIALRARLLDTSFRMIRTARSRGNPIPSGSDTGSA
jgi:hypothetical protein